MIEGVRFVILNREQLDSVRLGLELARALESLYPRKINFDVCRFLIGNHELINALKSGRSVTEMVRDQITPQLQKFEERRKPYLLY